MKVLLDTNIVLDFLLEREPFREDAELLFSAIGHGDIVGYVTATTITDIFYEDALQLACAIGDKLEAIITRNPQDFIGSSLPILGVRELLDSLGETDNELKRRSP
ncbi:PIN domain-containing protein [Spirulina sp. 06S082]|uniref:PIN domain-containing protein n=1 Tax=Spirulina sp. 06S082 TaxID=3110248 RepID=UPI002B20C13C|nr:PIN domain-containing protein [Spirulina sp. 06S082]MEA5472417.1 PIN domain-containing protein [Spirulina sp. 06S082]